MINVFPKDCNIQCGHLYVYDLSVDDLVYACDKLGVEVDACDMDFVLMPLCPLTEEQRVLALKGGEQE